MLEAQAIKEAVDSSLEVRVVGLSGSLRSPSATRMAVQYALKGAEEEGAKIEVLDLAAYNLPYWGLEREEAKSKQWSVSVTTCGHPTASSLGRLRCRGAPVES
jgi:NADPH-dependent FMN reductase